MKSFSSLQCGCGSTSCEQCKKFAQQLKSLKNNNNTTTKISSTANNNYSKCLKILGISGICMILLSCITYVIDPQAKTIKFFITMNDGSYLYSIWQKPPVDINFNIYIFNVTNSEKFLAGEEKLKFEELGPYEYREVLEHENVQFNDNGTITYTPRRTAVPSKKLLDDTFAGRGLNDKIISPNLPLLAISTKTDAEFPDLVQVAYSTLVNSLNSTPFLKLSVRELLWGYDNPIVTFANTFLPHWIFFKQFGILDRIYDQGENVVTMDRNKFSLTRYNGNALLYEGQRENILTERDISSPKCQETLEGAYDAVLFSANVPKTPVTVYRKALCRTIKFEYEREEPTDLVSGVPGGLRFVMPKNLFNASESPLHNCHCGRKNPNEGPCYLKAGLSDLYNCYYGLPVVLSFPHFYGADPSLLEQIDGLESVPEKHISYIVLQQKLGIPIHAKVRLQINLKMRKNKYIKRLSKFKDMTLPLIWIDFSFTDIPSDFQWMLDLCLQIIPLLQYGFIYGAACLGFSCLLAATLGYFCQATLPETQNSSLNQSRSNSYQLVVLLQEENA